MTGARFARTGRCRFFAGFCALIVMIGMVAIFHSSQQELDDVRHSMLQCEQNMEALKKRWQITMEQKSEMETIQKEEQKESLSNKRNLEQRLKEQNEQHAKEQLQLEKLQQTHKLLQHDHEVLVNECAKTKKQQLDDANSLEKKLQSLRAELKKSQNLQESEVAMWKEKYNAAMKENTRLEALLNVADAAGEQTRRLNLLQDAVAEYASHCQYKPKSLGADILMQGQINNPLNPAETTQNTKLHVPQNEKYFKEQQSVSPGLYHIPIKMVNRTKENSNISMVSDDLITNTLSSIKTNEIKNNDNNNVNKIGVGALSKNQLPFSAQNNRSFLILNSVENFQIIPKPLQKMVSNEETQIKQKPEFGERRVLPLSAPRKLTSTHSTTSTKFEQRVLEAGLIRNSTLSASSSSSLPPPNQRKQIPANINVAPIPEFDQLLRNDAHIGNGGVDGDEQALKKQQKADVKNALGLAGIDAALEDTQRQENDDGGTNNRYANVVNDMEAKSARQKSVKVVAPAAAVENDSGAHEIKDQDNGNEQNFNLPVEDDNNFFDAGIKRGAAAGEDDKHNHNNKDEIDNEDDDDDLGGAVGVGAGDIVVKNQHLLEGDNLNNEVAGDQGKEFPDGLRIEDANEEDEDEDEYANLAAREQGAQAIRN